ncbi:TetR-like C-terminal domain-containing protein [Nonomuraea sp. CA-218870]|uniref:TetR-like C-terminal domain-containing protein n=1 Tax=Nonomuraea sp. CA-218870 TaxID=3239998 RepID=UPI003D8DCD72
MQHPVLMMTPSTGEGVPPAAQACFAYMLGAVRARAEAGVRRGEPERLALALWSAAHGCAALLDGPAAVQPGPGRRAGRLRGTPAGR